MHLSGAPERAGENAAESRGIVKGVVVAPATLAVVAIGFLVFPSCSKSRG